MKKLCSPSTVQYLTSQNTEYSIPSHEKLTVPAVYFFCNVSKAAVSSVECCHSHVLWSSCAELDNIFEVSSEFPSPCFVFPNSLENNADKLQPQLSRGWGRPPLFNTIQQRVSLFFRWIIMNRFIMCHFYVHQRKFPLPWENVHFF